MSGWTVVPEQPDTSAWKPVPEEQKQTPAESGFFENVGQGLVGAAKSAARSFYNSGAVQGPQYLQGSGLSINTAPAPAAVQPSNTAQRIGGNIETAGELVAPFLGAGKAATTAAETLPAFGKAAPLFEELKNEVGNIPVDLSKAVEIANDAKGMMGHTPPKAMTDLITRLTPKNVEFPFGLAETPANPAQIPKPVTYKEARDLYSAVSKLTAQEKMQTSGPMFNKVTQFADAIDEAIRSAIPKMTDQQKYAAAMEEYARAGDLERKIDLLKKYGLPAAGIAILGGMGAKVLNLGAKVMGQ